MGICLLYHVNGDSAFTSFICEMVHSYMYMKITKHLF